MDLLAHKNYLRILQAVQRKPMRFGEIQEELELNPTQVDRAMKYLRKGLWVVPVVAPSEKGRLLVEYKIGKRGAALLRSFKVFSDEASQHQAELGADAVAELQGLLQ